MFKFLFLLSYYLVFILCISTYADYIEAQPGTEYIQNFNALGTESRASLPFGWIVDKQTSVRTIGNIADALHQTDYRSGNNIAPNAANGIYNFGHGTAETAEQRAVGWLASGSGTASGNLYARLKNIGSESFRGFEMSYTVEKFRQGSNTEGFAIQMYFSFDGEIWHSGGENFYHFFEPDDNNDGYDNAPGLTQQVDGYLFTGLINPDEKVYLAWNYSVASGSTTTNGQALAINNVSLTPADKSYFHEIDGLEGSTLEDALHDMIAVNENTNYNNARLQMHGNIDNFNNQVRCVYTGEWYDVDKGSMPASGDLDAEHLYPQSWFEGHPQQSIARADLHALVPTHPPANNSRANHPFDYVESISTTWGSDGYFSYYGQNTDNKSAFEPADDFKGNAARAVLYFAVRYYDYFEAGNRFIGSDWDVDPFFRGEVDMLNTLLLWHITDPVDEQEQQRNQDVFLYQENRNPFIDHPEFVSIIWGPIYPPAPEAFAPDTISTNSFIAHWKPVHASTEYRLDVSPNSTFTSFVEGYEDLTVAGTFQEISGLKSNTTYYYRVRAVHDNADGPGDNSNIISVTTLDEDAEVFIETFENLHLTGTQYTSGSFIGNYDIQWFYEGARNDSGYPINGGGILLGSAGDNSRVYADLTSGIRNFSVEMRKAFTGSGNRQVGLYINGERHSESILFGNEGGADDTIHTFSVDNINLAGELRLEVRNILGTSSNRRQLTINNVTWTQYQPKTGVKQWMLY